MVSEECGSSEVHLSVEQVDYRAVVNGHGFRNETGIECQSLHPNIRIEESWFAVVLFKNHALILNLSKCIFQRLAVGVFRSAKL